MLVEIRTFDLPLLHFILWHSVSVWRKQTKPHQSVYWGYREEWVARRGNIDL